MFANALKQAGTQQFPRSGTQLSPSSRKQTGRALSAVAARGPGQISACGGSCSSYAAPNLGVVPYGGSSASLDPDVRADMEARFQHDFSRVRIHTDNAADLAARQQGAAAYTVGQHIVFAADRYEPSVPRGRRLLAHELVHVLQQETATAASTVPSTHASGNGGVILQTAGSAESMDITALESEADTLADRVLDGAPRAPAPFSPVSTLHARRQTVLRTRVPVPNMPLCGKTLTDIEVLPPATKDLEPCLPKGVPFTRINIVGRDATSPSGKNQVFNLHAGYYTDTTTGKYCAMIDDSKECIAPRCLSLGCFPTLKEVAEAIKQALVTILKVVGIVLLVVLIAIIIALLGDLIGVPVPAMASDEGPPTDDGSATPDNDASVASELA